MVDMSSGTDVGGNLTVETTGTGSFDMGDGTVTGDATLDATGYTDMSGNTPGGDLDLTATRAEAVMHLQIQAATFATPVGFTVTRVDPVTLAPESGLDDGGDPATIDPVAAYQFDFEVPTLDRDAELSFDIVLAQLDAATRTRPRRRARRRHGDAGDQGRRRRQQPSRHSRCAPAQRPRRPAAACRSRPSTRAGCPPPARRPACASAA